MNAQNGRGRCVIAAVSTPPPITGQATAARILIESFEADGIDHRVFSTASSIATSETSGLKKAARTMRLAGALARTSTPEEPIFYLQMGQGTSSIVRDTVLLGVAAARRWPIVGHVHGGGWRTGLDSTPAPIRRIYLRLLRRADALIVLTPRLGAMFDGTVLNGTVLDSTGLDSPASSSNIVVIGNGVESTFATRAAAQPAQWAPEPTVAFLSNLLADKGVDTVIEAARLAHDAGSSTRFVLAGNDPEGRATSLPPNTTWVGVVDGEAKNALLASAQIFVLPTRYRVEGEPISILEAYHVGLPVISSDQGGIADIVDESRGAMVDPDDPHALLAAIDALTADRPRWEAIAANNRRAAVASHSTEQHLEAMYRVLGLDQRPSIDPG